MKITKRHLNEDKLAIVNRHLQKQLTLLPLSAKLQDLVIQLSNYQMKEPPDVSLKQRLRSSVDLAQDLLRYIAVNEIMSTETQSEDYQNFLLFLPVELVAKTQLSSVVCAQRLVFFRFLIDIVAAERSRLSSNSTESAPPAVTDRASSSTQARRKTIVGKRRSSSKSTIKRDSGSDDTPEGCDEPSDYPAEGDEVPSIHAAHGSVPSTFEAEVNENPGESDPFEQPIEQPGDECEKPASQLQQQLEAAIAQLRQSLPAIDSDLDQDAKIYTVNPAIRATYLAAVACQQSVHIMLENSIDVDSTMSDKLMHFIEALAAIKLQTSDQASISPPAGDDHPPQYAPKFPPPYPESTVPEENDDHSESGTVETQFPPAYAITAPSYWTFAPSIPEPKSSIAKLASKSPSNKSADLRSHFMSRDSPGVGAYNIQRGENLMFEQRPSYSFGPTGEPSNKAHAAPRSDSNASTSNSSVRKPSARSTLRQRMKSSLAFTPPTLRPPEEDQESLRVHVASQCDDSRLQESRSEDSFNDLPPHYGAGDANEAPDERPEGDEAQDLRVETEMDRALRLQQRMFMDEFVQQVVSNQDSPPHFVARVKSSADSAQRSGSRSKPYWATSQVSPGIEKLLQRQRRVPSASKPRAPSTSTHQTRPTRRKAPPSPPPRRQLDNDQHLAWAARISELYQAGASAPEQ
ncbi:hypothetical protein PF005_g18587 [Phytophthora fragariae]|uniref:Uncharacterized protein n=1 Tax=Phytophthora fragariae TaxID=53985 RepID=A0A6A3Y244_9STRA|nr:hypothetical protein PF003_g27110 [Phytophthora fragariae]KAE8932856.1 hypothetical protein PF009_g17128 [Phytophthora fragariae]KAE8993693.1 hypothetical protein PF011_g17038 [Phytophthora fragariae]KAE9093117.1 hypothetical protein PF007_g18231 [Phytophthora fragariae]KAE9129387.1 hypothetical protein PF006_g16020 [Phytophthora fragariae]